MKIYRNITLKKLLLPFITIIALILISVLLFDLEIAVNLSFTLSFSGMVLLSAMALFGIEHYKNMLPYKDGYKFFHSVPCGFERYRNACVRDDIIYFILSLIPLSTAHINGFFTTGNLIIYISFMIVFAVLHIYGGNIHRAKDATNTMYICTGFACGTMFTAVKTISDPIPDYLFLAFSLPVMLFAAVSAVFFYKKLKANWYI